MTDLERRAHDLAIAAIQAQLLKDELTLDPFTLATNYHSYYRDFLLELDKTAQEE